MNMLGRSELDEFSVPYAFRPRPEAGAQEQAGTIIRDGLKIQVEWLGSAQPLASGKNALGRFTRFVVPYTRQTILFRLTIDNQAQEPISLDPHQVEVTTYPDEKRYPLLALDYFKEQWPTQAVQTPEMLLDQATALGEVIRTLYGGQVVLRREKISAMLPFLQFMEPEKISHLHLHLKQIQVGSERFDALIVFDQGAATPTPQPSPPKP